MRGALVACAGLALLAGACASPLGTSKARTLERGRLQLGGSLDGSAMLMKRSPGRAVPLPAYTLGVGARYGVWHGIDVGARLWGGALLGVSGYGAAVDGKLQIVRASTPDAGLDATVGLDLAYHAVVVGGAPIHTGRVTVPMSFGWNTGGGSQLFAGPRVALDYVASPTARPVTIGHVGGHVGYAWRVFDHLELTPELHATWSPLGWDGRIDNPDRRGLTVLHLGASASWEF